jgi:hypothetical protein
MFSVHCNEFLSAHQVLGHDEQPLRQHGPEDLGDGDGGEEVGVLVYIAG